MNTRDTKDIAIDLISSASLVNCRASYEDIGDLVESLQATGLQMPIGVTLKDGAYALVYGFRRLHAAKALGWTTIEARVIEADSDADLLILNLQENVTRKNLTPIEEGYAIQRIMEAGKTPAEIRQALGFSKTLITQRLALLEMSSTVQRALQDDGIGVGQARAISEAPESHQERLVELAKSGATTKSLRMEADLLADMKSSPFGNEETQAPTYSDVGPAPVDNHIEPPQEAEPEMDGSIDSSIKASLLDILCAIVDDKDALSEITLAVNSVDFSHLSTRSGVLLDNALYLVTDNATVDTWGAYNKKVAK
jgi:ParB/RepB/Spo0J family partition protein